MPNSVGCVILMCMLASPLWSPVLQHLLRHVDHFAAKLGVVILVYVPGIMCMTLLHMLLLGYLEDNSWAGAVEVHVGGLALVHYLAFWIPTCLCAALWSVSDSRVRHGNARAFPHNRWQNVTVLWTAVGLFVFSTMLSIYLGTYKTLQAAVEAGNVPLVERRLQHNLQGVGANNGHLVHSYFPGESKWTSLLPIAIQRRDKEMIRLLLKHGAERDHYWRPAAADSQLYLCLILEDPIQRNDNDMVSFLLENGFSVNARDHLGRTPLHSAVEQDAAAVAQLLLRKGANPNARDNTGKTPLDMAVEMGRTEILGLVRTAQ